VSSELRLDLLGGLQIMLDGRSLAGDLSQKGLALLCYLAVEERVHPRQGLASLLWGDFSETDAATSLRQVLAQLRRALGSMRRHHSSDSDH
jgi:DNA-binding SARP family transcriptional activator